MMETWTKARLSWYHKMANHPACCDGVSLAVRFHSSVVCTRTLAMGTMFSTLTSHQCRPSPRTASVESEHVRE